MSTSAPASVDWTATGIAGDVRSGRRSAADAVGESLTRIREYDSDIEAFQVVRSDRAIAEPAAIDGRE